MKRPWWCLLAAVLAGCAGPGDRVPTAGEGVARIVIENRTAYPWAVRVGGVAIDVPAAATEVREVPAGEAEVVQERSDPSPRRPPARRFRQVFAAGQTYHWAIATVLSP